MHLRVFLALVFVTLSGCVGPSSEANHAGVQWVAADSVDLPPPMMAELFPGPRPVVANATWSMHDSSGDTDTFTVDFNGVHDVHDEFGRITPSLIFTTEVRDPYGGTYVIEDAFALADGRNIGWYESQYNWRIFNNPDLPHVSSAAVQGPLAFLALWSVDGDQSRHVPHGLFHWEFEAYEGKRGAGGCDVVAMQLVPNEGANVSLGPNEERRVLMCFDGGHVPAWTRMEWTAPTGSDWAEFTREEGDLPLPARQGQPWPQEGPYTGQPWQVYMEDVRGKPLYGPPSSEAGDWADQIAERAATLALSPSVQLAMQSVVGPAYTPLLWFDLPSASAGLLDLLPPPAPQRPLQSETSIIAFGDGGAQDYMAAVETYDMGPEQEPLHAPQPMTGLMTSNAPFPSYAEVPPLVAPGDWHFDYRALVPYEAEFQLFSVAPLGAPYDRAEFDSMRASWLVFEACFAGWDGAAPPRAVSMSAVTGQIQAIMEVEMTGSGCGARGPDGASVDSHEAALAFASQGWQNLLPPSAARDHFAPYTPPTGALEDRAPSLLGGPSAASVIWE